MDDQASESRTRALLSELARATPFASPDVSPGVIAMTLTAVVQGLTSRADIAIVFRLVSETLGTEEWTPLSVNTVTGSHIGRDAPIRQPLQELPVPVGRVGRYRFWLSSLPLPETGEHVLRGHRFWAHPCCRCLHSHDHATVVVDQIVVVVPQPSRRAALGGLGRIRVGGRYLFLLMYTIFRRVLLFQLLQVLTHGVMDLRRFHQLLTWNTALLRRIGFHETAIDRQVLPLRQSHFHTLQHDLFKQFIEQLRLLKPSVAVFPERGVMRNLLIEAQTGEPAPRQVHAQFLRQLPFAGDAVQIADQQNAQQKLGINGRTACIAVARFQPLPHKGKADVFFDEPQQLGLGNLIFPAEVVEQRFRTVVLPHHDQQASENGDPQHGKHSSFLLITMLLPPFRSLITVTFSTPTPVYVT